MKRARKPPWTEAQRLANIRRQVDAEIADGAGDGRNEDPLFKDRRLLLRLLDEADRRYAIRWLKEPKESHDQP